MNFPEIYQVQNVTHPSPIFVEVPGSKSITNRALLLAALAEGTSRIRGVLFSEDSRYFLKALQDLGFPVEVSEEEKTVTIRGFGGQIPWAGAAGTAAGSKTAESAAAKEADSEKEATAAKEAVSREAGGEQGPGPCSRVYVGSAGTAARFLAAFLGLSRGTFHMDASEQMKRRPMGELLTALESLGAVISYEEEKFHFPFTIRSNGPGSREVTVDVDKSSQFLSALLISSVLSREDFTIHVKGNHGMAYVEMTLAMMEQFGVKAAKREDGAFVIPGSAAYQARDYEVEPDLSAACYFYAAGAVLKVPAKVYGVKLDCMQGDIRFLSVLRDMGCGIVEEEDGVKVLPPANQLRGGAWDLSAFSDQALTLAAIAPFAEGTVKIEHIGHIRYQECDRIEAILVNLRAMGINCCEEEGTVVIEPHPPEPARIRTFEDHRVAMSFAVLGLVAKGISIENPACCRKTFENYFEVLENCVIRSNL